MNIEQLQKDRKNGVIIGRVTFDKLIEAANEMEQALSRIRNCSTEMDIVMLAEDALNYLKKS